MVNPFEEIESKLSVIETLLRENLNASVKEEHPNQHEEFMTVDEAAEFLHLTVPTIYSKVSKNELPYMKRSKRLYFSRTELLDYLKDGRKKSNTEIEQEAEAYLSNNKKRLNNGK